MLRRKSVALYKEEQTMRTYLLKTIRVKGYSGELIDHVVDHLVEEYTQYIDDGDMPMWSGYAKEELSETRYLMYFLDKSTEPIYGLEIRLDFSENKAEIYHLIDL